MTAKARNVRLKAAAASYDASFKMAAPRSGARNVRKNHHAYAANQATDLAAARAIRCAGNPAPFQQLEHHPASRAGRSLAISGERRGDFHREGTGKGRFGAGDLQLDAGAARR